MEASIKNEFLVLLYLIYVTRIAGELLIKWETEYSNASWLLFVLCEEDKFVQQDESYAEE